jgi:PAS domain S-box-containing protein
VLLQQGYFNVGLDRPLVARTIQANVEIRFFAASNMLLPSTYQTIFQNSPIGSYLLSTTPEVAILDVNQSFLSTVSLTREQMVGRRLFDVFPDNPSDQQDTGVNALRQSIAKAVASGQTQVMPAQRFPISKTLPGGEVIMEERFWNAANTPIYDETGKMICVSHVTTEVTKQIQAEIALRQSEHRAHHLARQAEADRDRIQESEERYRLSLEASGNIGTWAVDPETSITVMDCGFAKLFGIDGAVASRGAELRDLIKNIHSEDRSMVLQAVANTIETGERYDIDYRIVQPSGEVVWVTTKGKMFNNVRTGEKRFAGVAVDITSRKQAEQKLQDNDRRKDEFLAMLAHELRNPLAPISAAAELLQLVKLNEERVRQTSQIIGRQVKHMTSLVDDLLDVSRVTRGLVELDNAPVDIRHIVSDSVEQVTSLVRSRRHHLALHLSPETTMVRGDKKRLIQVVTNILNNAAKYTQEGGNIELTVEVHAEQVSIEVSDNGVGMSPELVAHAFDLFVQEKRTSDRSSGGLGLGLALVRSLVNLHGGTVKCESAGLGQGSRFTVCLPRLVQNQTQAGGQNIEIHPRKTPDSLLILIVDDNADAASLMAMLLEASGHEVVVEHSPGRALELAKKVSPDVCLLDIGLPEMDGNELAQRLRAEPETADSVLIAVTGYGQDQDRKQTQAAGFNDHLVKPVDFQQLHSLLANVSRT